jgi:hypothetical protein
MRPTSEAFRRSCVERCELRVARERYNYRLLITKLQGQGYKIIGYRY